MPSAKPVSVSVSVSYMTISSGPYAAYQACLEEGRLQADPAQAHIMTLLDQLAEDLCRSKERFWRKPKPVKGLYIWGGVGRGKSMLMDLFYSQCSITKKKRIHYHDFMQTVHSFLTYWRGLSQKERRRSQWHVKGAGDDPIPPAAAKLSHQVRLLCLDEFQVTQIADAMILSRLFTALFANGITLVATSNRGPQDLYKNGLNRHRFLPFIETLQEHCRNIELVSARDYRLERLTAQPVWYTPLGRESAAAFNTVWQDLIAPAAPEPACLYVSGRKLVLPMTAGGITRLSFKALCDQPLGTADYLALAAQYHTLFLEDIPKLTASERNQAIRFTHLIDALYEAKTNLVTSAEVEPEALYTDGEGSFEFQRTVSRLYEMRSTEYLSQPHSPQAET